MERRNFIKNCCYTAAVVPAFGAVLQSCEAIHYAVVGKEGKTLTVPKQEFIRSEKSKESFRKFVLIEMPELGFPICVYRLSGEDYKAMLMRCTHRACELTTGGGMYSCPCHGSEFSLSGKVLVGPAEEDLESYKVELEGENIRILLS